MSNFTWIEKAHSGKIVIGKISLCEFWSFWNLFSRAPIYKTLFFGVIFHVTYYINFIALEKCKKKRAICLKLFWYKVFVHWKLNFPQFPGGFRLKVTFTIGNISPDMWTFAQLYFLAGLYNHSPIYVCKVMVCYNL